VLKVDLLLGKYLFDLFFEGIVIRFGMECVDGHLRLGANTFYFTPSDI